MTADSRRTAWCRRWRWSWWWSRSSCRPGSTGQEVAVAENRSVGADQRLDRGPSRVRLGQRRAQRDVGGVGDRADGHRLLAGAGADGHALTGGERRGAGDGDRGVAGAGRGGRRRGGDVDEVGGAGVDVALVDELRRGVEVGQPGSVRGEPLLGGEPDVVAVGGRGLERGRVRVGAGAGERALGQPGKRAAGALEVQVQVDAGPGGGRAVVAGRVRRRRGEDRLGQVGAPPQRSLLGEQSLERRARLGGEIGGQPPGAGAGALVELLRGPGGPAAATQCLPVDGVAVHRRDPRAGLDAVLVGRGDHLVGAAVGQR